MKLFVKKSCKIIVFFLIYINNTFLSKILQSTNSSPVVHSITIDREERRAYFARKEAIRVLVVSWTVDIPVSGVQAYPQQAT